MHINSLSEYNELAKAYDIFKRDDNYPAFFSLLKREFIDVCKLGRDVHSLDYQKYENALEQKWPEVKEYERVANSFEYNKSATPWACYSAASILVGQIIQKLLTGHSTLDGKTFLLNLETLVARKGIEI